MEIRIKRTEDGLRAIMDGETIDVRQLEGDEMSELKRPTCETCPYGTEFFEDGEYTNWIRCGLRPAIFAGAGPDDPIDNDRPLGEHPWMWSQPLMMDSASCSSHPDFPAYIAALKTHAIK